MVLIYFTAIGVTFIVFCHLTTSNVLLVGEITLGTKSGTGIGMYGGIRGAAGSPLRRLKGGFWDNAILSPQQGLKSVLPSYDVLLDQLDDEDPCPLCPLMCLSI